MHHHDVDSRAIGEVCGSCHYFAQSADSFTGYKCFNIETKHPPFQFPIVDVRETTPCCTKYWSRHILASKSNGQDLGSKKLGEENLKWVGIDERILKWGGASVLFLFVLGLFRDKLGDLFPMLRGAFPWLFK